MRHQCHLRTRLFHHSAESTPPIPAQSMSTTKRPSISAHIHFTESNQCDNLNAIPKHHHHLHTRSFQLHQPASSPSRI